MMVHRAHNIRHMYTCVIALSLFSLCIFYSTAINQLAHQNILVRCKNNEFNNI